MSIVKVQQHNQYLVKKCEIFFIKTPYFIYNGEKQRFFSRITQMETNDEIDWVIMLLESRNIARAAATIFIFCTN